jgi:hypothetical protein
VTHDQQVVSRFDRVIDFQQFSPLAESSA